MPPTSSGATKAPSQSAKATSNAEKTGKVKPADNAASQNKTYGRHATMPVLQADTYAEIELPQLARYAISEPDACDAMAATREAWVADDFDDWASSHTQYPAVFTDLREACTKSLCTKPIVYVLAQQQGGGQTRAVRRVLLVHRHLALQPMHLLAVDDDRHVLNALAKERMDDELGGVGLDHLPRPLGAEHVSEVGAHPQRGHGCEVRRSRVLGTSPHDADLASLALVIPRGIELGHEQAQGLVPGALPPLRRRRVGVVLVRVHRRSTAGRTSDASGCARDVRCASPGEPVGARR